jgi:hypothetical protein
MTLHEDSWKKTRFTSNREKSFSIAELARNRMGS